MWKSLNKIITPIIKQEVLLTPEILLHQQFRTTFIVKRKTPPYLHKAGSHPKRLRSRHYVYELVKDTDTIKRPDIEVILTSFVEGLGDVGNRVKVRPNYAYNKLLLPGLAVYASPENMEKYKDYEDTNTVQNLSSTQRTINILSKMVLSVIMNKEVPWTLKPWHIRTSFRKCGYHVPEDAITMPAKSITGPNTDIENKEFYITITIDNNEKVNVRCRIHHWSTTLAQRLPHEHEFWKQPGKPIFSEDAPILETLAKTNTTTNIQ